MRLIEFNLSLRNCLLLLCFFTILIYSNSVRNEYNMDDDLVTGDYSEVKNGIKGIPAIFSSYYIDEVNNGVKLKADYRPITRATFAIEYQFFGANPYISHIVNLLIYLVTVIVVFKLAVVFFQIKNNYFLPFSITLFFLVHPLHTEVVDSLKNREELLSILFGLSSILYLQKNQKQIKFKFVFCFLALLLLSLLSKLSMAVVFMIFPIVYFYLIPNKNVKFNILLGAMSLISVVYFIIIYKITTRPVSYIENPLIVYSIPLASRIATIFLISLKNIQLQLFPWHLSFYYGYNTIPISTFENPYVLLSILIYLFIFTLLIYFFIRREKKIVILLILWLANMFMYSNAIIITTGILSERALYVASIPLAFLIGIIIQKSKNKYVLYLIYLFVIYFSARTFIRNFDWKNNDTLMSSDLKHLKNSSVANFIYANYLDNKLNYSNKLQERIENADTIINYYENSINVYPSYALAYHRIADIKKYTLNDLTGSIPYYEKAYNNDTTKIDVLYEIAKTNMELLQFTKAKVLFERLYSKTKSDTLSLFYYAQCLDITGDTNGALKVNKELLALAPNTEYPYLNLGTLYYKIGKKNEAIEYLEHVVKIGNRDSNLLNNLSEYFNSHGNISKSTYYKNLIPRP